MGLRLPSVEDAGLASVKTCEPLDDAPLISRLVVGLGLHYKISGKLIFTYRTQVHPSLAKFTLLH